MEIDQLDAELDEYITLANQAIVDKNFDLTIDHLQKAKQISIDLDDTTKELNDLKRSITNIDEITHYHHHHFNFFFLSII